MFNKAFRLTHVGIYPNTAKSEIKKIKVVNYCVIVGLINSLFFILVELLLQQLTLQSFLSYSLQLTTLLLAFFLQKKQKYFTARLLLLLFGFFIFFYNANFAYKGFYGEYMYVLLPLISLFFFRNRIIHYSVLLVCILAFYVPNMYLNIYPSRYFGYLNVLFLFIGSFTIVNYFRHQNKLKEASLEKAYSELKKRQKDELAHLQLKSLKAQMNPHFVFNALNSIQEYIVLNKKNLASDYLGKFADLIRSYLNQSNQGEITLEEEIRCLNMYLDLEKLRFEDKLNYTISINNNTWLDEIYMPTMLIQPYVENALKHGLFHRETNRVLKIEFQINTNLKTLKCSVIDNGIGRDQAEKLKSRSNKGHQSFATKATQERLALLNHGKEEQIHVNITDLFDTNEPAGTRVDITIPIKANYNY